ncbi:hypothetical protein CABS01_01885 [Colletotrichum abscissum]|uniref:Uncharacterized protein n=1 Tax=Colletotrichum abscissum TaxID=1671311 RepID=A0A9Q0AZQ9_9PEZI|nr:uncharacterized protein CABS01_01885 [Colletotrichum abscissum]KAI3542532.1 hypothetical protein CABS02_10373 [Colletotrichum abscissum]KAK1496078.1 hypothetical protein CABS01_01885 [Colletotrichum abscissum]
MHVCTLPQSPVHIVGGHRRSAWYHSLPRWRPSKVISLRPATSPKQGVPERSRKGSRRFESQTMAYTPQNGDSQRSTSFDANEKLLGEKAFVVEVSELEVRPLLGHDDEYLSRACLPRKRSLKTRFRIRRLSRSRSDYSSEGRPFEESNGSYSSTKDKKQSLATRKAQGEGASGNQRGSSMNCMAYHIAVGLSWSMPAPFDMMPTGYPTRLF